MRLPMPSEMLHVTNNVKLSLRLLGSVLALFGLLVLLEVKQKFLGLPQV
jgi:hypothetical protein